MVNFHQLAFREVPTT